MAWKTGLKTAICKGCNLPKKMWNTSKYCDECLTRECLFCNKKFKITSDQFKKGWGNFCSRSCAIKFRLPSMHKHFNFNYKQESKHHNWKGGYSKHSEGYILKRIDKNKYQFEHRYVMEQILGRKLKRSECVHHINHIRTDNRPENLEILSRSEHTIKYHRKQKKQ